MFCPNFAKYCISQTLTFRCFQFVLILNVRFSVDISILQVLLFNFSKVSFNSNWDSCISKNIWLLWCSPFSLYLILYYKLTLDCFVFLKTIFNPIEVRILQKFQGLVMFAFPMKFYLLNSSFPTTIFIFLRHFSRVQ